MNSGRIRTPIWSPGNAAVNCSRRLTIQCLMTALKIFTFTTFPYVLTTNFPNVLSVTRSPLNAKYRKALIYEIMMSKFAVVANWPKAPVASVPHTIP